MNSRLAPIESIQKVYLESYGLKKYAPIIFHPIHFSPFKKSDAVYYSLAYPTTLEFSPKSRKISSTLNDLSELKHILHIFLDEVRSGRLNIEETVMGKLANRINFDFFHNKNDKHGEIKSTNEIFKGDPLLLQGLNLYKKRKFPDCGTFIRGCIRLTYKE